MKINKLFGFLLALLNTAYVLSYLPEELFKFAESGKKEDIAKLETSITNPRGTYINAQNERGDTLTHIAARQGNFALLETLLKYKPNLNMQDKNGDTPLMLAFMGGDNKIINLLLQNNADPNISNQLKDTPLMRAIQHDAPGQVIDLLLEKKANVTAKDKYDLTAIDLAITRGVSPLILLKLLEKRKAAWKQQNFHPRVDHVALNLEIQELLQAIKFNNFGAMKLLASRINHQFRLLYDPSKLSELNLQQQEEAKQYVAVLRISDSILDVIKNAIKKPAFEQILKAILPLILLEIDIERGMNLERIGFELKFEKDENIVKISQVIDANVYLNDPERNRNRIKVIATINIAETEKENADENFEIRDKAQHDQQRAM